MVCSNRCSIIDRSELSTGVFAIRDCSSSLFQQVAKGEGDGGLPLPNLKKFSCPNQKRCPFFDAMI